MRLWAFSFFLLLFFYSFDSYALLTEISYWQRSPRALLMGDAYTSQAEDEYTLFYNPAGLARNGGVELSWLNPDISASNYLQKTDLFQNIPSTPSGIADRFTGVPIYLKAGITPSVKMGPIGFSFLSSFRTDFALRNKIYPMIDLKYGSDKGFVVGYAHTFGKGAKIRYEKGKIVRDNGIWSSVGASVKYITRQAINREFALFGPTIYNTVINNNTSDPETLLKTFGLVEGQALGLDVGFIQAYTSKYSELAFGLAVLDVSTTSFTVPSGTEYPLEPYRMQINSGIHWKQDFYLIDYSLSVDVRPLNWDIPFSRKLRWGASIGLPFVRVFTGMSEGFTSQGVELNLWPIKIVAGLYSVETGTKDVSEKTDRFILYLNLLNIALDI